MSLFDVIRYPVDDWRNLDALAHVPIEITRLWALECLSYIAKDYSERTIALKDVSAIHTAISAALFNHCRDGNGFLDLDKLEFCCYHFTRLLRKRIEDF